MRMLRYLLAIALVSALSGVAKADDFKPGDFQMVVVDPFPPASLITQITTDTFQFTLSPCDPSQLFGLDPAVYLGCFTGENETSGPLTSLRMLIPVFDFNDELDQPGCSPVAQDIFATVSCGFTNDNLDYFVDFSGGNIPPGSLAASVFTIAVAGVPPEDFPKDVTVVANAPEPSSIMLLSTGVLSIGLFGVYRRRRDLCTSRP
jgi:hypothetical protein